MQIDSVYTIEVIHLFPRALLILFLKLSSVYFKNEWIMLSEKSLCAIEKHAFVL